MTAGVDSPHIRGAATTAVSQGIGDATIKMLRRWKSSVYQLHVKTPRSELAVFFEKTGAGTGTKGTVFKV